MKTTLFLGFILGFVKITCCELILLHSSKLSTSSIQKRCNVLSLSGGGSFGAVQMGLLDRLVSDGVAPVSYDIITGISAGGINAGFLSYYTRVNDALVDIYDILSKMKTSDVYTSDYYHLFSTYGIYSTDPLKKTLSHIVETRSKLQQTPSPFTLIGTTNVNRQTLDVYQFHLANDSERVQLLMSTSAIPMIFPPQIMNGDLYVDGGVISNEMIQQAVSAKYCDFYNFTFINTSPMPIAQNVSGFASYVSAMTQLLLNTFDYQLAEYETIVCSAEPRGMIHACFPTHPDIQKYNMLDFDNGETLYQLGKSEYTCVSYDFC